MSMGWFIINLQEITFEKPLAAMGLKLNDNSFKCAWKKMQTHHDQHLILEAIFRHIQSYV